jgi:nucleotide-binding universal stress UspA family protein
MYKKIMVALDGSELAECALPHLETVLKGAESAEVIVVQAVEPIVIPHSLEAAKITSLEQFTEFATHQKTDAEKYLNGIVARLAKTGANIKAEIIYGKASEALIDYANKNDIDLVIIATHGRSGVSRWVWGSVADRLIRSIRAPVLVVRASGAVLDP